MGTDIPVLEALPLLLAHVHLKGVQLRSTCGTSYIKCTTIRPRAANKSYRTTI